MVQGSYEKEENLRMKVRVSSVFAVHLARMFKTKMERQQWGGGARPGA